MSIDQHPEALAYLLGELDDAGGAAFERALAGDAALRDEVERLRPVVARLDRLPAEAWDVAEPPPLRMPGDARPAVAPAPMPTAARRRWWQGPLTLRPALAATLAVLLLAGGAGLGALLDDDGVPGGAAPAAQTLALDPFGDAGPAAHGRVLVSDGDGSGVTLRVGGLEPTGDDAFYELWLLGDDGQLVALGSFRVDRAGDATLRLPLPVDPESYRYFDVSLEPADGDAGHSGRSVLRGSSRA